MSELRAALQEQHRQMEELRLQLTQQRERERLAVSSTSVAISTDSALEMPIDTAPQKVIEALPQSLSPSVESLWQPAEEVASPPQPQSAIAEELSFRSFQAEEVEVEGTEADEAPEEVPVPTSPPAPSRPPSPSPSPREVRFSVRKMTPAVRDALFNDGSRPAEEFPVALPAALTLSLDDVVFELRKAAAVQVCPLSQPLHLSFSTFSSDVAGQCAARSRLPGVQLRRRCGRCTGGGIDLIDELPFTSARSGRAAGNGPRRVAGDGGGQYRARRPRDRIGQVGSPFSRNRQRSAADQCADRPHEAASHPVPLSGQATALDCDGRWRREEKSECEVCACGGIYTRATLSRRAARRGQ